MGGGYQYLGVCEGATTEDAAVDGNGGAQYIELAQAVSATLEQELQGVARLQEILAQASAAESGFNMEMDAYRIQISTHNNLLSIEKVDVKNLEKANVTNRLSIDSVKERVVKLTTQKQRVEQLLQKSDESIQLSEKQFSSKTPEVSAEGKSGELVATYKTLSGKLTERKDTLEKLRIIIDRRLAVLQEIQKDLSGLAKKFDGQIKSRKKEQLFERDDASGETFLFLNAGENLAQLKERLRLIVSRSFWLSEVDDITDAGGNWILAGTVAFIALLVFLFRIRRQIEGGGGHPRYVDRPWLRISLMMLGRSLPLLGSVLYIYIPARIQHLHSLPIIHLVVTTLLIFLFARWTLDFLTIADREAVVRLPSPLTARFKALIVTLKWVAVCYSVADFLSGDEKFILAGVRLLLWCGLFVFCALVFGKLKGDRTAGTGEHSGIADRWTRVVKAALLGIFAVGGLMEISGYGAFSSYWLVSWAKTAVAVMMAVLVFMMLKEWELRLRLDSDVDSEEGSKKGQPIQWVLSRVFWFVWIAGAVLSLLLSWDASQAMIWGLFRVVKYPVAIGKMQISLMGIFYAIVILFITQLVAKEARYILLEKLLNTKGFEPGLKDSVSTITTYLVWGFGIIIAMHAFGLNTASMAVGLGALGIGLGFGLQNIFSNFISGIILLFERPIQVGDEVEIGGVWATVKKINVRATVVQTMDNASLIIPNSDFVSSQVTNWSFKDKRLRRRISVGVAYGSDAELVRQTLLEIAEKMPNVLRVPAPDVLFKDFGDSALIFQLRYWTTLPYMLTSETDVRFEINRLFKERNITIAFPQLDLHLNQTVSPAVSLKSS